MNRIDGKRSRGKAASCLVAGNRLAFCFALLLLLAQALAHAQGNQPANGLLLVAKPGLADPNFRETVVLVTQTPDAATVGVILNRPTRLKLAELLGDENRARDYKEAVYMGGPVMRRTIVALLHAAEPPAAPAFHVLKNVYLTMQPELVRSLLATPGRRYRLYAGFSGWAPGQLQAELERGGWYALRASEALLFRRDTSGMWRELVEKASRRPVVFAGP